MEAEREQSLEYFLNLFLQLQLLQHNVSHEDTALHKFPRHYCLFRRQRNTRCFQVQRLPMTFLRGSHRWMSWLRFVLLWNYCKFMVSVWKWTFPNPAVWEKVKTSRRRRQSVQTPRWTSALSWLEKTNYCRSSADASLHHNVPPGWPRRGSLVSHVCCEDGMNEAIHDQIDWTFCRF